MLSLAHTITSLPLAVYLDNPILIFFTAILLHLLMDSIYHWNVDPNDGGTYPYAAAFIDVTIGIIGAQYIIGESFFTWKVLAAIAGGNMPDILHSIWFQLGPNYRPNWLLKLKPVFDFHEKIQFETRQIIPGLIPQAVVILMAIYLLP